jgi:hypothetical protein
MTVTLERREHRVSDQPIDLAFVLLDRGNDRVEEGVQHLRHRGRIVLLGVGAEALQVGEEHSDGLRVLFEIETGEALLGTFAVRHERDQREGDQHQHVPFPPRRLPVASERDCQHRLGEEDEGDRQCENEVGAALAPERQIPADREAVEPDADEREHDERPGHPLGNRRVVQLGQQSQ